MVIDVTHRFDIGYLENGLDPDKYNSELKEYHKTLWSKKLPCGKVMELSISKDKKRLEFEGFTFNPDSITHSFKDSKRKYDNQAELEIVKHFKQSDSEIKQLLDNDYERINYVIAASIIFPLKGDNGKTAWTINQARGMSYAVHDRIDYTLECIKRYYQNKLDIDNPLYNSLKRYNRFFFELFVNFDGFVDFFFLNDLLDEKGNVKSFTGNIDFEKPFPYSIEEYKKYLRNVVEFVDSRSKRIEKWAFDNGYGAQR